MLASLTAHPGLPAGNRLNKLGHVLVLMPAGSQLPEDCPDQKLLMAALARLDKEIGKLSSKPIAANTSQGNLRVWMMLDEKKSRFEQFSGLRAAFEILLDEEPAAIDVLLAGDDEFRTWAGELAAYVGLANGTPMPSLKQKDAPKPLRSLNLWGLETVAPAAPALAEANLLARMLTVLPPNALTPGAYQERLLDLAADLGWRAEVFDMVRLRELGAGAFVAVAQGSAVNDAAIIRLSYQPPGTESRETPTVALVGKGICFDTGGHNLKGAKHMAGMHEDMAGSAVALGILLAASRLALPVRIDAWLALARNELSPLSYRQGDVVTALDGTSIEVVHTDAEGRMVLADALVLAARQRPALVLDFATLTGSMVYALGNRYAGVFASDDELSALAIGAGAASGERICVFPMAEDYEEDLDSDVADIKQCTLDGEADHILAALFLKRFVGELPWLHVDLSASSCEGGLGAIGTNQTGFGVAWGIALLEEWLRSGKKSH